MSFLPQLYLRGNLLVGEGPARSGYVSQGFWCDAPVLYQAGNRERNCFHNTLQQTIQLLPPKTVFQVRWSLASDYVRLLNEYIGVSCPTAFSLALRQSVAGTFRKTGQKLRRERSAFFLGSPVPDLLRFEESEFHPEIANRLRSWGDQLNHLFRGQGGSVRVMPGSDHFRMLAEQLNPSFRRRLNFDPFTLYEPSLSIEETLWLSEVRGRPGGFGLDGILHAVISLSSWPALTWPTMMQSLTQLPHDYDLCATICRLESGPIMNQAQREVDRLRRQYSARPDERVLASLRKKEVRIRRLADGGVIPVSAEFSILVRGANPESLQAGLEGVKGALHGLGASYREAILPTTARHLFVRTLPGVFWTAHPGCAIYGEDTFVSDFLPVSGTFVGHPDDPEALYHGAHGNIVGVKSFAHRTDVGMPFHTLTIGGTGQGKSAFLARHLAQTDPFFDRTFIMDAGGSYQEYGASHGVKALEVRDNGSRTFNPFDTRSGPVSAAQISFVAESLLLMAKGAESRNEGREDLARFSTLVSRLYAEHAEEAWRNLSDVEQKSVVRDALLWRQRATETQMSLADAFDEFMEWRESDEIQTTAARISFSDLDEFASRHPEIVRAFLPSTFNSAQHLTLGSAVESLELSSDPFNLRLATLLRPWLRDGTHGTLFDGPGNVSFDGRVTLLEYGAANGGLEEGRTVAAHLALRQFCASLRRWPRAERKRLVIEELSSFLAIPGADLLVREIFEQFRKYNCQCLAILQQYSRLNDASLRAALVGNVHSFFIFNPNSSEDLKLLGDELDLPQVAREAIALYGRPDSARPYSEFTYFHRDPRFCGTLRHVLANIPVT